MRFFLPFLFVLFIIAILFRVDFFLAIFYLLFFVYLFSRLWMQYNTAHLNVQRRFVDHAFCGDQVAVDLAVRNTGWLPIPWIDLHESLPVALIAPPFYREVISLGMRGRQHFRYTLHCQRRGYYPIGPLTAQGGDLVGMVGHSQKTIAPEYLVVYPRVLPLERIGLPTRSPLVALPSRTPLFEDPARLMGVRDYEWGDSPRRIHWTATASAGRLLVKRYQSAIARETLICLDLNEEDYGQRQRYTATELAIVVAASVASHIVVTEGLPAGLITEALDPLQENAEHTPPTRFRLPPRRERAHLISLLEVLARVEIAQTQPFVELLRDESANLAWGATLLVITGRESEALFDTLVYLRRSGFAVALILVQPSLPSAELRRRSDLLGVPVHRVWQEHDLEAWQ